MTLAGCVYCHRILVQGQPGDPWRMLPSPQRRVLFPAQAARCPARPRTYELHVTPGEMGRRA